MKIMVTGGAGFIGSHVVERFLQLGHQVAILDDLSTGRRENVPPEAKLFQVSLLDAGLPAALAEFAPEVVVHHAAQVNVRRSVDDPDFDARVNILGSIRLYDAAAKAGARKVVYASSGGAIYGEPAHIPAAEDTPIKPLCPYGASKYAAEKYLELYGELAGLRYTILRYANVFGPRQDPRGEAGVIAIFCEMMLAGKQPIIFGDGSKTRDYVYVEDIARANELALDGGDGRAYNVGVGRQIRDDQVFNAIRDALGVSIEAKFDDFRKGEVRHIALDASRLRRDLGWFPSVAFEDGVAKTVAYYREKHGRPA